MITATSTGQAIATGVADALGEPLVDLAEDGSVETADGVAVDADERIVVIGSTTTAGAHLELMELQERANERNPSEVVTVIPYLG